MFDAMFMDSGTLQKNVKIILTNKIKEAKFR